MSNFKPFRNMFKLVIGGFLAFGASVIAGLLLTFFVSWQMGLMVGGVSVVLTFITVSTLAVLNIVRTAKDPADMLDLSDSERREFAKMRDFHI